jgi:[acyl-carrier-protein] S-malonyltransferase
MSLCFVFGGGFVFGPTGSELWDAYAPVRRSCAEVREWTGVDVAALLPEDFTHRPGDKHLLELRQAALSWGLVDLLAELGIRPGVLGGMSLGGKIAASLAGAIERRALTGLIMAEAGAPRAAADGRVRGVASVLLAPGEEVDPYCGDQPDVHLAADGFGPAPDGTRLLLLAGYLDELQALAARAKVGAVNVLGGWGAWHSPLQWHVRGYMAPRIAATAFQDPRIPLFSALRPGRTLTADQVRQEFLDNYTSFVSVVHLHTELERYGVQLGLMPGSGTAPELNNFPFPVVQIETPEDVTEALTALHEFGYLMTA